MTAIIEKVKKLLALAESSNIYEAELAAQKAQELLSQHNLTMDSVNISTNSDHLINREETNSRIEKWRTQLSSVAAVAFDCKVIQSKSEQRLWFYGYQQNPQIASYTFLFLQRTAERLCNEYIQELKFGKKVETRGMSISELFDAMNKQPAPKKYTAKEINLQKNSYLLGMVQGINKKFKDQKAKTPITPGALVPVMNTLIDNKINIDFGSVKKSQTRRSNVYASAYNRGTEDGKNIGIHGAINGNDNKVMQIGM